MNILGVLKNPRSIFFKLGIRGGFRFLSDEKFLKYMYWSRFGKKLNLENPKTFNEKIQWLKINNFKPEYSDMVDKNKAKEYVSKVIGEQYVIPTIGVWDRFEDIDFAKLPNQFVLKTTHDSGGVCICKDKNIFDVKKAKTKINASLARNYYWVGREKPYRDVKPRIIAEEYLANMESELIEYKIFCFDGNPQLILVCRGEGHSDNRTNDYYDMDFRHIPVEVTCPPAKTVLEKPKEYDELIDLARKLSVGFSQIRVDFYVGNSKIYFGELTLYHDSGFGKFEPQKYDEEFGNLIKLNYLKI